MIRLQDMSDISDGRWRCPDCKKAVSIRNGSFFSKSKITLQKWLLLMHWWSRQYSIKDAAEEAGVSELSLTSTRAFSAFDTHGRKRVECVGTRVECVGTRVRIF